MYNFNSLSLSRLPICYLILIWVNVVQARAGIDYESSYGKVRPNDTILKLQRTEPYYKRNRAHVCSFYIRGECTRGAECPYRHEMPVTGELSQQNIKDRYYGYVFHNIHDYILKVLFVSWWSLFLFFMAWLLIRNGRIEILEYASDYSILWIFW